METTDTAAGPDGDLREHLFRLELALARRDAAGPADDLETLLDDDFVEHGASGRRWDRAAILDLLASAPRAAVDIDAFDVVLLAPDVALVTYHSLPAGEAAHRTLRSSIWVRRSGRWRIRFHQGTPAPASAEG